MEEVLRVGCAHTHKVKVLFQEEVRLPEGNWELFVQNMASDWEQMVSAGDDKDVQNSVVVDLVDEFDLYKYSDFDYFAMTDLRMKLFEADYELFLHLETGAEH
ncbi:hypothetical protein Avbf_02848 [Armadillidium vulgare]|nr:hypothetical protein Avbf_02848 [Armadillidium vulgare]